VALAVVAWSGVLLACCLRTWLAPRANSVYPIFATAARAWQAGADLYRPTGDPYRYSPLAAALLVPFSLLPGPLGGVLWRLLNAGVLLAALFWWARAVLPGPLTATRLAVLFLLAVPLTVGSLNNGQSNPLVLGLLLIAVAAAATDRWNLAALGVALACLFKIYPMAVGLLLAALYPRRFALRLVAALGLGLALPFLLQEPAYVTAQYGGWLHHLRTDDRSQLPLELAYRDLRLLLRVCGLPLSAGTWQAVQLVAAGGALALCLVGRRAGWPRRRQLGLLFALGCCWMTIFGPATESATYLLLAPALAAAVLAVEPGARLPAANGLVLVSYALFLVSQTAVWFPGGKQLHALGVQPLAALLLLGGILLQQLGRSQLLAAAPPFSATPQPAEC
jgi:hypothetical protein